MLKAAAAGDVPAILKGGKPALVELLGATGGDMTVEAFQADAAEWLATAEHPEKHRPFISMVYQPMLELLTYLRAEDYETFIVSGGGTEFIRAFAEGTYGVPPAQVVGSEGTLEFRMVEGAPQVMREAGVAFVDDGPGKPVGIARHIGQRPVFVAGNSDGDLEMLQWGTAGDGPRHGRHRPPHRRRARMGLRPELGHRSARQGARPGAGRGMGRDRHGQGLGNDLAGRVGRRGGRPAPAGRRRQCSLSRYALAISSKLIPAASSGPMPAALASCE